MKNISTYYHENVQHKNNIPAFIALLDGEDIQRYFPTEIFVLAHWHRSLEISLIEGATVILQIGNKESIIENGFTCINSGVVHSLYASALGNHPQAMIVLISYDFIKQHYPDIDHIIFYLSLQKDHQESRVLYNRLKELYLHQDHYSYGCLLDILSLLLRKYQNLST